MLAFMFTLTAVAAFALGCLFAYLWRHRYGQEADQVRRRPGDQEDAGRPGFEWTHEQRQQAAQARLARARAESRHGEVLKAAQRCRAQLDDFEERLRG